jgi:propionate catabolism operon transcriptional regulator
MKSLERGLRESMSSRFVNNQEEVMKIKTLVIAPYNGLGELALTLSKEQDDLDIAVREGDLKEALPIAKEFEKKGYEIIISRGGTAQLLRQYTTLPVIDIQVSGYDILRILTLVKDYQVKMQLIGFPNICQGVVSISNLLDINIPYTIINHQEEVESAVLQAKLEGVQVVVGDTITVTTAEQCGLQGILITSGRESLQEAFQQAKQLYQNITYFEKKLRAYEALCYKVNQGIVIFDEDWNIELANEPFKDIINHPNQELKGASLIKLVNVDISSLMGQGNSAYVNRIQINGEERFFTGGKLLFSRLNKNYFYLMELVETKRINRQEKKIQFVTRKPPVVSFSQMTGTSKVIQSVIEECRQFSQLTDPIILYGEIGTGKTLFASAIHSSSSQADGEFIEINITGDSTEELEQIEGSLSTIEKGTCVIEGIEHLSPEGQRELIQVFKQLKVRLILLFNQDPTQLLREGYIAEGIYESFFEHMLHIPPLRERLDDLEEYIRTFIAKYNAEYGKQIVGLRKDVLDELFKQPWTENLNQLKNAIKGFVKASNGSYIERDVLPLLELLPNQSVSSILNNIDKNKTLAEIEKDIIHAVLKEENMNQTKAAKRLGINRSTLWRKLK